MVVQFTAEVKASYLGEGRAQIEAAGRSLVVDQRSNIGQPGAGFCPAELVSASLSACIVLTMAVVADSKGIAVSELGARVTSETTQDDQGSRTVFHCHIHLGEGLTERERWILLHSARHCEVRKLLTGKLEFVDEPAG